ARLRQVPVAIRLDALGVALAAAAVAAAPALGALIGATSGSLATVLVALAYPTGDVLLLALASGTLAILGWRAEWRWALLVVGFMLWAISDTIYVVQAARGTFLEGSWSDASWPAAFLLIAAASWVRPTQSVPSPNLGLAAFVPPMLFVIVALGVSVFAHQDRLATTLTALSLAAFTVRFAVTLRDVQNQADSHRRAGRALAAG
ncbi:MAG TPA: GGDEF-domain containing protein, partial [Mycobacterium sp.]|nr:GGDEF-domain containing protein [Mycobacterium sp.]